MIYNAEILHSGHQFEVYLESTGTIRNWREGGLLVTTKGGYSKEILDRAFSFLVEPLRTQVVERAYKSALGKGLDSDQYHFRLYQV
jgi:hypothetical protein